MSLRETFGFFQRSEGLAATLDALGEPNVATLFNRSTPQYRQAVFFGHERLYLRFFHVDLSAPTGW